VPLKGAQTSWPECEGQGEWCPSCTAIAATLLPWARAPAASWVHAVTGMRQGAVPNSAPCLPACPAMTAPGPQPWRRLLRAQHPWLRVAAAALGSFSKEGSSWRIWSTHAPCLTRRGGVTTHHRREAVVPWCTPGTAGRSWPAATHQAPAAPSLPAQSRILCTGGRTASACDRDRQQLPRMCHR
jgi:hypothetical protein